MNKIEKQKEDSLKIITWCIRGFLVICIGYLIYTAAMNNIHLFFVTGG